MATAQCGDDNCASTPCLHGGGCTNTGDKEYQCDCPHGLWEGENCADDVDNCVSQKVDLNGVQYGGEYLSGFNRLFVAMENTRVSVFPASP